MKKNAENAIQIEFFQPKYSIVINMDSVNLEKKTTEQFFSIINLPSQGKPT